MALLQPWRSGLQTSVFCPVFGHVVSSAFRQGTATLSWHLALGFVAEDTTGPSRAGDAAAWVRSEKTFSLPSPPPRSVTVTRGDDPDVTAAKHRLPAGPGRLGNETSSPGCPNTASSALAPAPALRWPGLSSVAAGSCTTFSACLHPGGRRVRRKWQMSGCSGLRAAWASEDRFPTGLRTALGTRTQGFIFPCHVARKSHQE